MAAKVALGAAALTFTVFATAKVYQPQKSRKLVV